MKKLLPALAALALTGCAHTQYRANYLQSLADHDCMALQTERLIVESKLDPKWTANEPIPSGSNSIMFFADALSEGIPMPNVVGSNRPMDSGLWPGPHPDYGQKRRMKRHAKWQAIVLLQHHKGCLRNLTAAPDSGSLSEEAAN